MAGGFGGICAGFRSMALTMFNFAIAFVLVSGERKMKLEGSSEDFNLLKGALNFLWQSDKIGYHHVWPVSHHKNFYTSIYVDENKNPNAIKFVLFCSVLFISLRISYLHIL